MKINVSLVSALAATFACFTASLGAAQTITTLHSFAAPANSYPYTNADGAYLETPLILSGNTLYGTAKSGGSAGDGTIFAVNTNGTGFTNLHIFSGSDGYQLLGGLVLSGNTLYGTASQGGVPSNGGSGNGTVYAVNTDGTGFATLYVFTNGSDGAAPEGGLVVSGGTLYGTTSFGGSSNKGTVFALNTNGTLTNLYNFSGGDDGANPTGSLILNGNTLYGAASSTFISSNAGAVFAINTDGSGFVPLHTFPALSKVPVGVEGAVGTNSDGAHPSGPLLLLGGTLYGTAPQGGGVGIGTLFSVNTDGSDFAVLDTFTAPADFVTGPNTNGAQPNGGLILLSNMLYGTGVGGGKYGNGAVFAVNTNGAGLTALYSFGITSNGLSPQAGLVASGGNLYGTTPQGGAAGFNGGGTVFSLSLATAAVNTSPGALQVTIAPGAAVAAGAEWQIEGGAFHSSGAVITSPAPTNLTVVFKPVPGFATPASQAAGITGGQTNSIMATYLYTNRPVVTITSPKTGASVSNATLHVSGTAGETLGLGSLYVVAASAAGTNAGVVSGGASFSNWTATVQLNPGANTISAWAVNSNNNLYSASNSVSVKYIPSAPLQLMVSGNGTITSNGIGALLAIGTNYTVKAAPAGNNLFSNWVGGTMRPYTQLSTNSSYTFKMEPGLVLEANFVPDFFLAAQGAYSGLFAAGPPRQQTNSGAFTINVTPGGVVSGSLVIGAEKVTLNSGQFNIAGTATVTGRPAGGKPLTVFLQLVPTNQSVQGNVTDGNFVAQLSGNQSVFTSSQPATQYEGPYTFSIAGANDPMTGPFGTSYGPLSVTPTGGITYSVYLADGNSALALSSAIAKDGSWPLYVPLYNGKGSIWGWNNFTNDDIVSAPTLSWINPGDPGKGALYTNGFTNQQATLLGSYYIPGSKPLLALTNAQVILSESGWPSAITNQVTLGANNAITVSSADTNGLKLTIPSATEKSGLISGSFQDPARPAQTLTLNGVLLQFQTEAAGFFTNGSQSGSFILQAHTILDTLDSE